MSASVLYLGNPGPLFEALKLEMAQEAGAALSCHTPGETGDGGRQSISGLGRDPGVLKGHSLVIVGRGARLSFTETLSAIKGAQVPALILEEDEAALLRGAGQGAGVPIIVAGGPFPGLGALLLGMLLRGGAQGERGQLSYRLDGLSPFWAEYLRGTFGRSSGAKGSPSLGGGGVPIPSGEVGALAAFGADLGDGPLTPFPLQGRISSPSRRLSLGLLALDTPPGRSILGLPGGTPDPEAFLTGLGGKGLTPLAPHGQGGGLQVTLRSRYRTQRARLPIASPGALAGKCLWALGKLLGSWSAPIGLSSPLSAAVFPAFEEAMAGAIASSLEIEDLPHTLDPRAARRLQILAP